MIKRVVGFKILLLVVFIIVLSSGVFGKINNHRVKYDVESGVVETTHEIEIENSSNFSLILPDDSYNFEVSLNDRATEFSIDNIEDNKIFSINLNKSKHNKLVLKYKSKENLESGDNNYFIDDIRIGEKTENLNVKLILPEKLFLARPIDSTNPSINPRGSRVSTTGKRLVIEWDFESLEENEIIHFFVVYERKGFSTILFISIVILLALVVLSYKLHKYYTNKEKYEYLPSREKKIIRELKKSKNNIIWQKKLQIKTGFTKSKISRAIKKLEENGIIEKIPFGASNKIKLKK